MQKTRNFSASIKPGDLVRYGAFEGEADTRWGAMYVGKVLSKTRHGAFIEDAINGGVDGVIWDDIQPIEFVYVVEESAQSELCEMIQALPEPDRLGIADAVLKLQNERRARE